MKRREPTHSEDLIDEASCSSTSPRDCEGRTKRQKGNDYGVFLSFRGEDTRKGFTDYLYRSLDDVRIRVFRDDNELHVGEKIGPELFRNIRQSTILIPIISENYASSKWCLRELAYILKCKKNRGQIVLPIFYKVTPSQVGHLTGSFKDAIKAHKENREEMVLKEWKKVLKEVKKWEEALKEVTSLKGWESEKIDNGHEGSLVKIIVTEVMSKLKRNFQLHVPHQLVGIDNHIKDIMSFIDAKFNSICIIGIYGMGGIGKTTLAKALYNKLSDRFEYCRFVADCRETYRCKGIEYLQKQLISGHVSNMDEGIDLIKYQFARKKALILLDDIDDSAYLKYLVDRDWLEARSIIIITTRDEDVLKQVSANHMYKLNELSWHQSMILFSRHAFRQDFPPVDFKDVSHDVVSTTSGLPLALEVIGSFLSTKAKGTWKDMSQKWKKVPHKKVQDKLKISYDALDYEDQQIFLDIACFSIGLSKEYSTYMWESCKFFPSKGIEVLSLMSLIKIDEDGDLRMHDQLRDLGREIVHLENPKKPQKRSRLWNFEEVKDVLDNNKATSNIEALSLGKYGKGRTFTAKQFKKMTELRFLQVDGANFIGDFQSLLPKLRWLQWQDCPSDFAATNFHLKKLVVLDLSHSTITEDWGGWVPLKMATELKVLNLSFCRKLKRTPDLSAFEKLEILDCAHCINLEEIHPSIGKLVSLTELQLWDSRITKLPESIGNLQNLRHLEIGWMSETRITTLPESIGNLQNLRTLRIGRMSIGNLQTGITTLPKSIGNLQNLTTLNIRNTAVTELPSAVGMLANLQVLNASRCRNLKGLPSSIGELVSLNVLDLHHTDIRGLPESISKLSSLQLLDVQYCWNLREIPELPSSLTALRITFPTPSLTFLSKLTLLQKLTLSDQRPLECLPELPVRLSRVELQTGWPMTDVDKEMELRFSELIRDKSSGLRKATKRQEDRFSIEFEIEEAFSSK